tara:strand:+ start:104066 stop:104254 length:189 start_codon:yes stop_codon:yes gene_type:complete
MTPFQALNIRYKKLQTQVTKEVEDNYNRLIERIDELELENRKLKAELKSKSLISIIKEKIKC